MFASDRIVQEVQEKKPDIIGLSWFISKIGSTNGNDC